jgi:hypothetical protein
MFLFMRDYIRVVQAPKNWIIPKFCNSNLVRAILDTIIEPKSAGNAAKINLWEKILGAEEVRREAEGLFAFSGRKPETTSLTRINRAYGLKTVVVKPH